MADDKKDKVGGVSGKSETKKVEKSENVSGVKEVESASDVKGVGAVKGLSSVGDVYGIRNSNKEMLKKMISEEAEKLFASGLIPKEQREIVEQAVKMAVDAAAVPDGEED